MWIRFLVPTLFGSGWGGGGGVQKNTSKIKSASFHADPDLGGIFKFGSVRFRIRIETRESVFCASVVEPVRFCSTLAPDPTPGVKVANFEFFSIQFLNFSIQALGGGNFVSPRLTEYCQVKERF